MKTHFFLYAVLVTTFLPGILCAQFKIKSILISSDYIEIQTKTTYPNKSFSLDTSASAEGFSNDTLFNFQDTVIISSYHNSGNDLYGYQYDDDESISIGIDTANKILTSIDAQLKTILYNYYPGDDHTYTRFIQCGFLPYRESKNGDSLVAYVQGSDLNKIGYKGGGFFFNYSNDTISSFVKVLNFPDSAYVSVIIEKFPLHSKVIPEKKAAPVLLVDVLSKVLRISPSSFNYVLPCFDILGRKHDLEFLDADNTSATYSVRSLRPGVYFVNDGRETVKFMIPE